MTKNKDPKKSSTKNIKEVHVREMQGKLQILLNE